MHSSSAPIPFPPAVNPRGVNYTPYADAPPNLQLSFTFPYLFGQKSTRPVLIDNDPLHCSVLFGLVPGQRIDRRCTAVGLMVDDGKVHMVFHADGHAGAGMFQEGTRLIAEDVFVDVPRLGEKIFKYKRQPQNILDPIQPTQWYMAGVFVWHSGTVRCRP